MFLETTSSTSNRSLVKSGYGLSFDVKCGGNTGQRLLVVTCIPVASFPRVQAAAITIDWPAK